MENPFQRNWGRCRWGAEGLMMKGPSPCCLFKLHWWEGGGIRACFGFFPLSSWLSWNRCLNSRNIWMWVFKWGYKPQEKEQLQVADLEYRSWLEPATRWMSKKPHSLVHSWIICPFKYTGQLLFARNQARCWRWMVYEKDNVLFEKVLVADKQHMQRSSGLWCAVGPGGT